MALWHTSDDDGFGRVYERKINPEVGVKYRWTSPKYPKLHNLSPHLVTSVSNGVVFYRYEGSPNGTQLDLEGWREYEPIRLDDSLDSKLAELNKKIQAAKRELISLEEEREAIRKAIRDGQESKSER
jgi:hypothetical protein